MPHQTFDLIDRSISSFGAKVRALTAERWEQPTPCAEWSVRDVVNHVASEHLWAPHLLEGESITQVGDRYDGDVLGASPLAVWERASVRSQAAWRAASPDATVHLSFGDVAALDYGEQMLTDLVIHGWDVARGAGLDETIDPDAANRVLGYLETHAREWQRAGLFAAPVAVSDVIVAGGDQAIRLLALAGRTA